MKKNYLKVNENMSECEKDMVGMLNNIRNDLESISEGNAYLIGGEWYDREDLSEEELEDAEPASFYEYFEDVFDIEYYIGGNMDFRGVRLMVACGGPNIYIDTRNGEIQGRWWGDRTDLWIPPEICEEINFAFEEIYNCR